jgi:D-alanyl-D-alanine carboxypeptidase (penicillin-binding protein 5/6)
VVFGILGLFLVSVMYVTGSLVAPMPATAAVTDHETSIAQPAAQLSWPGFGASAITAVDYPGVTEFHGTTASLPIASMTKTITALVVLAKKPLTAGDDGPTIRFTGDDVAIWNQVIADGGSWAPVVAGSTMTEKQALEAMLLPSANNYAISLANWAYGSVDAYLKAARSWLASHNLSGTHLVDADGLDPGSRSTTKDLVAIGKLVLADPVLPSIVATKATTLPGAGLQQNTNVLLGVDGIDGIKTGNTDQAGNCLMFSADVAVGSSKVRAIGVVLGAPTHDALWAAVKTLLLSLQNGFHQVDVAKDGQVFGTYTTVWGATSKLVATSTKTFLVWSDTPVTVSIQTRPVQVGNAGDVIGQVEFTLNGKTETAQLALKSKLPDPGFWWRLAHPGGLGA